ncbi:hypothetical protein KP509_04G065200 [Ceratopteris richardii]|uniref:RWP-RK domain-containing protein n=1 Tax=Ceratopteris richardii TaxID=49495 RepID=A0A8T2UXR1_CERRI|nr:hypothetical protein KP509_04G065200 [Ceratopteris richardii]
MMSYLLFWGDAENVKSIHMYKKGNYLHIIQQEFLIKDGALTEANRLIHLACIWGESTDVQVSMDLTKLKQEGEGWRCLLDFCTSPLRSIHKLLPGSATLVRDVWSSASACINWERPPHVLSSFSACLEELQLLEGVPYKHVVADPISKTSQRLQHDLWQQWGSDLELASPKFSKTFELSSLRNQTNEKNTSMLGAASSSLPTCATSKNMGSLPWIQKHAEHCTHGMIDSDHDQKEMGLNLIGVACAFLPPDLNSAINQTEGSSQCKIFSNVLPLDLNRMQFMNLEDTVHAHNKNLNGYCDHISFDFEMIQSMKSASVSYSSRDGRSLEAVNFETLNHMKALDFQSRGSNGIRKAKEQAKFSKSTSTRSGSGRLSELTKDELTHYFNMPITQASKELKVGLTVLKKRCRIFGIPRWPHRKMKSINGLIRNIQVAYCIRLCSH